MSDEPAVVEPPVKTKPAKPKVKPRNDSKRKPQPPYAVIVQNDEDHTFEYVIELLQRVCGHKIEDALKHTLDIHNNGEASVWTGMLEVAELKRDQIRGFGPDFYASSPVKYPLGVRIEPLEGSE